MIKQGHVVGILHKRRRQQHSRLCVSSVCCHVAFLNRVVFAEVVRPGVLRLRSVRHLEVWAGLG
jgi:hypothetical protein